MSILECNESQYEIDTDFQGSKQDHKENLSASEPGNHDADVVWNLIVEQTNLYAGQKREPGECSMWYPLTVRELKAWIALTL